MLSFTIKKIKSKRISFLMHLRCNVWGVFLWGNIAKYLNIGIILTSLAKREREEDEAIKENNDPSGDNRANLTWADFC